MTGPPPRATPAPPLQLHLAGPPRLTRGGQPLRAGSRRALALAVVLALQPGPSRAQLCDLLWPGADPSAARRNLRRDLFRLRELGLQVDDAGQDTVAAAQLELAWPEPGGAAPQWLHGLEDAGGAEFEHWLLEQRAALPTRWVQALSGRAQSLEQAGEDAQALALWSALLDPTLLGLLPPAETGAPQEAARRAALRLSQRLGRHADALALSRGTATKLPASGASTGSDDAGAAAPHGPRRAGPLPERPPFIGRAALQAQIGQALAAGQRVLIDGAPGVGKTRLALQAAAALGPVLHARCRPEDAAEAFASAMRLLHALLEATGPDALAALPTWVRHTLAPLLPLRPGPGGAEPESEPSIGGRRTAPDLATLRRAFDTACRHLAEDNFSLVLLDDWQWADASSLALWDFGEATPGPGPALVRIVVHRAGELGAAALQQRRRLLDRGLAVAVSVPAFDAQESLALLRSLSGSAEAERFAARLHGATGGNAVFLLETLRHLFASQLLDVDAAGRWHTPFDAVTTDYAELPVPASVREATLARTHALGPAVRRMLEVASLAGDVLTPHALAAPAGLDELACAEAMDHALAAGLLLPLRDDDRAHCRFAHDLLRQTLAESLPLPRRQALQARLAEHLAIQGAAAAQVAQHFDAAAQPQAAAPWHQRAAAESALRGAVHDALRHYRLALRASLPPATQVEIHLALSRLQRSLADAPAARAAVEDALRAAASGPRALTLKAMLEMATLRCKGGEAAAALADLQAIAEDPALDAPLRAECRYETARALEYLGRHGEARELLQSLLATLPVSDLPTRQHALALLVNVCLNAGDIEAGLQAAEAALAVARQRGHTLNVGEILVNVGALRRMAGRRAEAEAPFLEVRQLAAQHGFVDLSQVACYGLITLYTDDGRVDAAEALLQEALAASPYWNDARLHQAFLEARYYLAYLRGDAAAAHAGAEVVLARARSSADPLRIAGAAKLVFDLHLQQREFDRAAALLAEAQAVLRAAGSPSLRQHELDARALQLAQARGQRDEAWQRLHEQRAQLDALDPDARLRWLAAAVHTALDHDEAALAQALELQAGALPDGPLETLLMWQVACLRSARVRGTGVAAAEHAAQGWLQRPGLPHFEAAALRQALRGSPAA